MDDDIPAAVPSPGLLTVLTTEHLALQSARGVISSESTSRATIYLGVVSSTLIAIGFLADSPPALVVFLAAALPVLVSLGVSTFLRLVQIGVEDVAHLAAMQRIRRRYLTLAPDAPDYFPDLAVGATPRATGGAVDVLAFLGLRSGRVQVLFTAATAVAIVNSLLWGVTSTLFLVRLALPPAGAIALGSVLAVLLVAGHLAVESRAYGPQRATAAPPEG